MTPEVFLSATTFTLAGSFTPGPNNAMLLASGVNHGYRRTLPHIAGIVLGYAVMFAAVSMGLGRIFAVHPGLYTALKVASTIYMLFLAWKIATSVGFSDGNVAEPLTFLQAASFQWVNPKGVALALAASASFINPASFETDLAIMLGLVSAMSFASASAWAWFGQGLRQFLMQSRRLRVFNIAMGLALVASLWPMLVADGL